MNDSELLNTAATLFKLESQALLAARGRLGQPFLDAVELINRCRGKVIITGVGKSGIAGMKIAATFSSTGMPALFLHSGEAGHGDLGVVTATDVVLALSYSGETQEITALVPRLKFLGVPVIALTGSPDSAHARASDVMLDVSVPKHPWPFGILPTASNTVTVATGEALALALLVSRGIHESDFASLHPGGILGRKILVQVGDLMHAGADIPVVRTDTDMREVLIEMTEKRLGVTCVTNSDGALAGIITDGDLRRFLSEIPDPLSCKAIDAMTKNPKFVRPDILCAAALGIMEDHAITSLPVINDADELMGIIHMHDIIRMEADR